MCMHYNYQLLSQEQCEGYLARIGLSSVKLSGLTPSVSLLNRIVDAHQKAIPFEDIDVYQKGETIPLDLDSLYRKVILKERGGYCFELNGLFVCFLRSLGFEATSCMCRVVKEPGVIRGISHAGNIVRLDGNMYFCDVGFGGPMPSGALLIRDQLHQTIGKEEFWPVDQKDGWWGLMRQRKGQNDDYNPGQASGAAMEILFSTTAADPEDYKIFSLALTSNPMSRFRQAYLVNLRTETGYKGIVDSVYTEKVNDVVTRTEIVDEAQRLHILEEKFGIRLD